MLGSSGAVLGPSWGAVGRHWRLCRLREPTEAGKGNNCKHVQKRDGNVMNCVSGASFRFPEGHLGDVVGDIERLVFHLQAILKLSWAVLEPSWAVWEPSWAVLEQWWPRERESV